MSNTQSPASAELIEQIEMLSGILYEAISGEDEIRSALLAPLGESFSQLAMDAQREGFRGIPELFRMLGEALLRQDASGASLSENDVLAIATWLPNALLYLRGELPTAETSSLIQGLAELKFMPETSGRVRELIENRLRQFAPVLVSNDQVLAEPQINEAQTNPVELMAETQQNSFDVMQASEKAQVAKDFDSDENNAADEFLPEVDFAEESESSKYSDIPNEPITNERVEAVLEIELGALDVSTLPTENRTEHAEHQLLNLAATSSAANQFIEATDTGSTESTHFLFDNVDEIKSNKSSEFSFSIGEPQIANTNADALEIGLGFEPSESLNLAHADDGESVIENSNQDIWIATEELAMATDAIERQLLPLMEGLSEPELDLQLKADRIRDYEFQLSLLGNALEILNLPKLKTSLDQVSARLLEAAQHPENFDENAVNALLQWQLAVLTILQDPHDQSNRNLLHESLTEFAATHSSEEDQFEQIEAELNRIRVGMDPAYKASRKQMAEPGDIELRIAPDVLPAVLDGMMRELPNNTQALSESVRRLVKTGAAEDLDQARRVAHTLKGDANIVGLKGIANLAHSMEDILVELAKNPSIPPRDLSDALIQATDAVEAMSDHVLGRGPAPDDALDTLQGVINWANALVIGEGLPQVQASQSPVATAVAQADVAESVAETATPMLQVSVTLLDELLRLSSETIVLARQIEEKLKSIGGAHQQIADQNALAKTLVQELDEIVALRGAALQSARAIQGMQVDPLELDEYNELHMVSRRLIETNADVNQFSNTVDISMSHLSDLAATQDRIQNELQEAVLRTRMVPVKNIVPRLQRVVRQTARTLFKEVELVVEGESVQVDSDMLDRLVEPLSHALRNAVDHGIEAPEERIAGGKNPNGLIKLSVKRVASTISFELTDDGRGLNYSRILEKARERGVYEADVEPTQEELARLILMPGFSTKEDVTQVSGRGIGMDVVQRRVVELKGTLLVRSKPQLGTTLSFELPAQLNAAHVALVRARDGQVAIVSSSVKQFIPMPAEAFEVGEQGLFVTMGDEQIPVLSIDAIALDMPVVRPTASVVGAYIQDDFGRRTIVFTQAVDEMRNVIVKSMGAFVAAIPGVRGATVLGNGGVAPVLDLSVLLSDMYERRSGRIKQRVVEAEDIEAPRCVVVDDSLSVRRALEQLMQDAGFDVRTAVDGMDALEVISQRTPSIVLVDLEMPRMNGLELTTFLRSTTQTKNIPIIMITSRSSEKHLQMAQQAGVTHMLGKPYTEDELVRLVRELTQKDFAARVNAAA